MLSEVIFKEYTCIVCFSLCDSYFLEITTLTMCKYSGHDVDAYA